MALYGNIWIFEIKLETGKSSPKHAHEFDHLHQVVKGKATMTLCNEGKIIVQQVVEAGQYFKVPANYKHQITALSDYHGNCIHAFRDTDGEVMESEEEAKDFLYAPKEKLRAKDK